MLREEIKYLYFVYTLISLVFIPIFIKSVFFLLFLSLFFVQTKTKIKCETWQFYSTVSVKRNISLTPQLELRIFHIYVYICVVVVVANEHKHNSTKCDMQQRKKLQV